MRNSIEMATGAAMEQISANPVVKSHVGGKLGTLLKASVGGAFIAAAMISAALPAHAADNSINAGCVIGGLLGGVLGNNVGGGDGRKIATAAGAIGGCKLGQDLQADSEYRQQQQAGYGNQQYRAPRPQYGAPIVAPSPMGNYMYHTFAQIDGRESSQQELPTQGRMAVEKAIRNAQFAAQQNIAAQQQYANAYEAMQNAQNNARNPEAQILMGSGNMQQNMYQYQNNLNNASNVKNNANVKFGSAGMQMAELLEYEASQGYNITPYAQAIKEVFNTPMSSPVAGVSPTTRQQVTFSTGVGAAPEQMRYPASPRF